MTTIKTSCSICGDVDLTPQQMTLKVYTNAPARSYYWFLCPMCGDTIAKDADEEAARLLLQAWKPDGTGLHVERIQLPLEVLEEYYCGMALTEDDVLDFTIATRGVITLDELLQVG